MRVFLVPVEPPTRKPTRTQLYKRINIDYYGFRDDDDGLLEKLEAKAEKKLQAEALEAWKKDREAKGLTTEYEVRSELFWIFISRVVLQKVGMLW